MCEFLSPLGREWIVYGKGGVNREGSLGWKNVGQLVRAREDKSRALGEENKCCGDHAGEYKARECTIAAEGLKPAASRREW